MMKTMTNMKMTMMNMKMKMIKKYMTLYTTMKMMSEDTTEPIQNRKDGAADRLNIHMESMGHSG